MNKLVLLGIALLAIGSMALTVYHASAAPTTADTSVAAKGYLDKLNDQLRASEGVSYTSVLYYSVQSGPGAESVTKETNTSVTVERPARILVKANMGSSLLAEVNGSGSLFTVYDAANGKYAQEPTTADLQATLQALFETAQAVFQGASDSGESLRMAIDFPISYLNGEIGVSQPPANVHLKYSVVPNTLNGKPVRDVTETLTSPGEGTLNIIFMLDPATNLPLEQVVQGVPAAGGAVTTILRELYSNFKLLSSPVLASTYAFTPPPGASIVALPTPPTPPVAPPASPAAPAVPAAPAAQTGAGTTAPAAPTQATPTPGAPPL